MLGLALSLGWKGLWQKARRNFRQVMRGQGRRKSFFRRRRRAAEGRACELLYSSSRRVHIWKTSRFTSQLSFDVDIHQVPGHLRSRYGLHVLEVRVPLKPATTCGCCLGRSLDTSSSRSICFRVFCVPRLFDSGVNRGYSVRTSLSGFCI